MKLNVSIVLYHTPVAELNNVLSVLLQVRDLHRIYLIDNSEGSLQLPITDPRISYLFSGTNLGFGTGHNIAIRHSVKDRVPFHLVMNSDITFTADNIAEMLAYMEAHDDVACMMPNVQFPTGKPQRLCKLLPTPMDLLGRRFLPESLIRERNARYELHHTGYDRIMNVPAKKGASGNTVVDLALKTLGARFRVFHRETPRDEFDLVVNATPVDPIPKYAFAGHELVYDLRYVPETTPLMARAKAAGCKVENGFTMLAAQAREQRRIWWS